MAVVPSGKKRKPKRGIHSIAESMVVLKNTVLLSKMKSQMASVWSQHNCHDDAPIALQCRWSTFLFFICSHTGHTNVRLYINTCIYNTSTYQEMSKWMGCVHRHADTTYMPQI
jgi:hypothetical protein